MGSVYSTMLYVVRNGVGKPQLPPADLADALVALKKAACRPEAGTWLGLTMTLFASGALTVDYTFDENPGFDANFDLSSSDYQLELERFPRAAASMPEWWREQILRNND